MIKSKRIKLLTRSFALIVLIGLFYNISSFIYIHQQMNQNNLNTPLAEKMMIGVGITLIALIIYHLISLVQILLFFHHSKNTNMIYSFAFVLGTISLMFIPGNVALLSDIGKQYQYGLSTPEWKILYFVHFCHFLFTVISLFLSKSIFSTFEMKNKIKAIKDEVTFTTAQYTGLLCGIIGLIHLALLFILDIKLKYIPAISNVFGLILISPYCFIVLLWLISKWKQKISDWYDEKQIHDLSFAALFTICLNSALFFALFIASFFIQSEITEKIWFPFYLFFTLTSFSGATLYFHR